MKLCDGGCGIENLAQAVIALSLSTGSSRDYLMCRSSGC